MPTTAQLRSEPWWDREIVTPELDWLGDELCRRTGRPRTAAGTKGNKAHLSGAHRSQEWLLNSRWSESRTYTVQAGLTDLQKRHIAGFDFTPGVWGSAANRALMRAQTGRLVAALKAGRLVGVREVIGTLDGRTVVGTRADGTTFRSDESHLDHFHLTLDRKHCANRALMERIVTVALGDDEEDFMAAISDADQKALIWRLEALIAGRVAVAGGPTKGELVASNQRLLTLEQKVNALATAVAGVDDETAARVRNELELIDAAAERRAVEQAAALQMLRAELAGELAPALVAAIREDLADLPPDVLDAAMDRALRRVLGGLDGSPVQA